jgi:paraquat-inducible protein A
MAVIEEPLVACHECDLLQREPHLPRGGIARCQRCGATLYRSHPNSLERSLAFTLGALILFIVSNTFPIVGLKISGEFVQANLLGAARAMFRADMAPVAALVLATGFVAPLVQMAAMIYLLLPIHFNRRPPHPDLVFRAIALVTPWGMVEVFMLGVLVTLVKLLHLASVVPGVAMWSLAGVMMLLAAAASSFDQRRLWARLEAAR